MLEMKWHAAAASEIFKALNSGEAGLSSGEAEKRIIEYGQNSLPEPKVPGIFFTFISQFFSPLIYILIAAAAIVFLMGETVDAVIILFVLIFNAIVGTIQEGRARKTLLALKRFAETSASVFRDGKLVILSDKNIVPGDVVILQTGDKVPADARILSANALKIDESSITGESVPAGKVAEELKKADLSISDRKNMLFKGASVVNGNGTAVVVATGLATEIGKISRVVASLDADLPLKKSIKSLSQLIITGVFSIGVLLMAFGLYAGKPLLEMFATVVSLSVSIIPEGLPIVMTVVLAAGVWRMTKHKVLVKNLQAVEALGQAKIIAVDKTGTLTQNEMTLEKVYIGGKFFDIRGEGYEPKGEVLLEGSVIEPMNHPELILAGRIASFCSDAHAMYVEDSKTWKISGDPTEAALGIFGEKIGFQSPESEFPKIFDLPFDYLTRYHATIYKENKKNFLSVVGAPEKILKISKRIWRGGKSEELSGEERERLENVFLEMSKKGFRVLAFAMNPDTGEGFSEEDMPILTFGGFYGMKDPLRAGVKETIAEVLAAGIRVIMITGDHKITARAIAEEAGFLRSGVITGEELEKLSDEELLEKFGECDIFARVTPINKLRIIELFKKRGEIVAMTGDGVNDAPSLAAADLGVAMGKIGTEVAKEASDLVLLDDNFGNILPAIEEGRSIYKNIKKVILYLFSTSIGEALTISSALFIGLPLPVSPAQIIWLNFVTDGFLDIALAMEPKEKGLLRSHFAKPSKYILDSFTVRRMVFMGIIIALGTLFIFSKYLGSDLNKALTMSLTTLAIFQWFNAWNCKSEKQSLFSGNPFNNIFLVGATLIVVALQIFAVYSPFMHKYLHTTSLSGLDWAYAIGIASVIIILEELRKLISRRRHPG